ncbi:MAG TPA: glutamine-hydrolyzing carbamoyl-phosphate synthase small subunit [Sphingobacterium sp.]|nr:glutamine-hydrolyzing carbamoyl-phosphate synthase small subunit [Sphingobacterium sp.]
MTNYNNLPAVLVLDDGTVYRGKAAGKIGTAVGEIGFNTSMTGYQEALTDPSSYGQIMIATSPHIGNYGVARQDNESERIQIAGLVCKSFNTGYSRDMAQSSLQDYFVEQDIIGISDIDTRALVRHIRGKGIMYAIISSENEDIEQLKQDLEKAPKLLEQEVSSKVSTPKAYYHGEDDSSTRIAVLDLGLKKSVLKSFEDRQVYTKVFPARTSFKEMEEWEADGYFISSGPGNPATLDYAVNTVKEILNADRPVFAVCLGHQVLAQAIGIGLEQMKSGHKGINHPVKNLQTGKSEITSQNHIFNVRKEDVEKHPDVEITHINLNDGSVEGLRMKNKKAFSVQYNPEAAPGPNDSKYLFDEFIAMIKS